MIESNHFNAVRKMTLGDFNVHQHYELSVHMTTVDDNDNVDDNDVENVLQNAQRQFV